MARFNTEPKSKRVRKAGGDTVNLAGGQAFSLSQKEELVGILFTSFLNDQFYRTGSDTLNRIVSLIESGDKKFAAKAAVYARNIFGMRSVSHVVAGEIARLVKGEQWTAPFFNSVVFRPDDMYETISYFAARYGAKKVCCRTKGNHEEREVVRAIPNALKKGFREAIGRFDSYQLAKYRGDGKEFTLVDLVNILRPTPTDKNREALQLLMKGDLRSTDTWESMLTRAGQQAENETDLANLKENAWTELLITRKLGYFALLRNLRNISKQAPAAVKAAIAMLKDERLIKKSKVMPFRYYTAYKELETEVSRNILMAISEAFGISCANVPTFEGKTLIVVDDSGSMTSCRVNGKQQANRRGGSEKGNTCAEIGAIMASVLARANPDADVMMFNTNARYVYLPVDGGLISNIKTMVSRFNGGGTDHNSIFRAMNKAYDRIIIMSDEQGWAGHYTPSGRNGSFDQYKKQYNCNPFVYSIDLQGYGTSQFDPNAKKVFLLHGFSEKIFDLMKIMESDKRAMIAEIEKIQFGVGE